MKGKTAKGKLRQRIKPYRPTYKGNVMLSSHREGRLICIVLCLKLNEKASVCS